MHWKLNCIHKLQYTHKTDYFSIKKWRQATKNSFPKPNYLNPRLMKLHIKKKILLGEHILSLEVLQYSKWLWCEKKANKKLKLKLKPSQSETRGAASKPQGSGEYKTPLQFISHVAYLRISIYCTFLPQVSIDSVKCQKGQKKKKKKVEIFLSPFRLLSFVFSGEEASDIWKSRF